MTGSRTNPGTNSGTNPGMGRGTAGTGRRVVVLTALSALTVAALTGIGGPGDRAAAATWQTLVDGSSFGSYTALERSWNYGYPWGGDHNGTARMYGSPSDHNHVYLTPGGVLNLKATQISWDEGTSGAQPHLPIRYHSGAVHAKSQVVVNDRYPNYEVRGQFQAPGTRGTWPAFWLTGVQSWPPESDILEFKGDARNWFNTFRTARDVDSTVVGVGSPGSWHQYRAWITKVNATDVDIHYYVDGIWKAVHHARGFVGKPMWLIVNLQMEGSSGSPGPSGTTLYRARDVYLGRSATW